MPKKETNFTLTKYNDGTFLLKQDKAINGKRFITSIFDMLDQINFCIDCNETECQNIDELCCLCREYDKQNFCEICTDIMEKHKK